MENKSDVKPNATRGFIPMQASPLQMNLGPGDIAIHEANLLQVPSHSTPPVQSANVMEPSGSLYSGRKHAFNPVISNSHVKRMKETSSSPLRSSLPGHSMDSSFRAPSPIYFQENQFRPRVQMSPPSMPFEKCSHSVQKSIPGSAFQIPRTGGSQSDEDTQRQNSFQDADFAARKEAVRAWGNQPLSVADPDLWDIMEKEKNRQWKGIELIASENFTSQAVIEALGSHLTNKYSEGMPGARYYGGNEYIDQIEILCWERALAAFDLDQEKWGVNVQCYSCTSANFAVYTALLQPKDRIMGLDSPSGGHLSHGYYTCSGKKVSAASIFYESLPYKVNPKTGYIDYDKLEEKALEFRPKILICGGSAYPREWDYDRFRKIADKCGAVLMCDMAHISGLIAAKECCSPFDFCDIVTSTTHKSLRGPRGGMIFYRKGPKPRKKDSDAEVYDLEEKISFAVFPSLQGGPHNNHIAALAVALKQVNSPEYKAYIKQVEKNAQTLANALLRRKCKLVTDGTDNHLMLWDLRPLGLTGNRYEKVCEMCHMTLNKNAVFGDSTSYAPGGVRIGTPAMTSRGCIESDFEIIAEFLYKAAQIARRVQKEHGKHQKEFLKGLQNNKDVLDLRSEVEKFASAFGVPGFDLAAMKYNR